MGSRANYVLIERGEVKICYTQWGEIVSGFSEASDQNMSPEEYQQILQRLFSKLHTSS